MSVLSRYQGIRVLVVDDNPLDRRMILAMLEALGIRAETACDGRQAVTAEETSRYDLILMDIGMPVMDGLTAIAHIRARERRHRLSRTPIYVVSSQQDPRDVRAARKAGADGHIATPLQVSLLLHAVHDALRRVNRRLETEQGPARAFSNSR